MGDGSVDLRAGVVRVVIQGEPLASGATIVMVAADDMTGEREAFDDKGADGGRDAAVDVQYVRISGWVKDDSTARIEIIGMGLEEALGRSFPYTLFPKCVVRAVLA